MRKRATARRKETTRRPIGVLRCTGCRQPQSIVMLWPCGDKLLCYGCMMQWIGVTPACGRLSDTAAEPGRDDQ